MLIHGDSMIELGKLEAESIDALVTDPPYGLSNFKTKDVIDIMSSWVKDGTHTFNRGGFVGASWDSFVPPPSLWKEVYRVMKPGGHGLVFASSRTQDLMGLSLRLAGFEIRDCVQWIYNNGLPKAAPLKIDDRRFEGFRTALKPSCEPAILVKKAHDGSTLNNILNHGVGSLNIDGCRIKGEAMPELKSSPGGPLFGGSIQNRYQYNSNRHKGRYPSNTIFDETSSALLGDKQKFFYCAKSLSNERHAGVDRNIHPTVKPIHLMRYLCRLITPPGGLVLDPFLGSGSTAIAAHQEQFNFIGIEREEEYYNIAQQRLEHWTGIKVDPLQDKPEKEDGQLDLF